MVCHCEPFRVKQSLAMEPSIVRDASSFDSSYDNTKYPRKHRGFFMAKVKQFGPLFIIIAALIWSFDGVLRRSLYSLPPAVIVFYEHILGAVILLFLFKHWFPDLKKMR